MRGGNAAFKPDDAGEYLLQRPTGGRCDLLPEQFGMCPGTHKRDLAALRPVNHQPVRLEVALPGILPLSTKLVVAETSLKLLSTRQPAHQVVKLSERLSAMRATPQRPKLPLNP